ncbi:hypothetical protein [Algoriphagus boritolerans]|uniref:nucleoside-diphosphate sugar epimerase/dehydratase n=1 Tax=Algoriphagus boritolerans TaxID=308111 RepID=UPI002FCE3DFC
MLDFQLFFPYPFFWLLISALRKDYKIGRTDEYDHTLRNLLVTLLWFLVATAILWRPLQSGNIRWIQLLVLGVTMVILMGSFRVFVHILLRRYRAKGNNYQNAVIVGKGGTSPRLADVFRIRKDFGINFLGYFDDQPTVIRREEELRISLGRHLLWILISSIFKSIWIRHW